jgi:hypothetical protein
VYTVTVPVLKGALPVLALLSFIGLYHRALQTIPWPESIGFRSWSPSPSITSPSPRGSHRARVTTQGCHDVPSEAYRIGGGNAKL